MQKYITTILVEKAKDDILNLRIEAKNRKIESQLSRWISMYLLDLQKASKEAHSIILEQIENNEININQISDERENK